MTNKNIVFSTETQKTVVVVGGGVGGVGGVGVGVGGVVVVGVGGVGGVGAAAAVAVALRLYFDPNMG